MALPIPTIRAAQLLVALLLIGSTILLAAPPTRAANVNTLLAKAEHDTNTVRTLIHHDRLTITSATVQVNATLRGSEDEVHNRERDFESVTVDEHPKKGKAKKVHYTADIIFMNGKTYYRTSFEGKKWLSRNKMVFNDPYTGGWKRGRTTVPTINGVAFHLVGTTSGQTHLRGDINATVRGTKERGTEDLWISGGSTPYVVRDEYTVHTVKSARVTWHDDTHLGPFNSPMVIVAPTSKGTV